MIDLKAIKARDERDWPDHEERCDWKECEICDCFHDRRALLNECEGVHMAYDEQQDWAHMAEQERHKAVAEVERLKAELAEAQGYAYSGNVMRQFDTAIKAERERCVGIIDEVINNPAYKHCLLTLSGILDSIEKLTP